MKKSGLPVWFPNVNSWLSALTLSVVISGLISIARDSDSLLPYLARLSNKPELLTIVSILILLSPLPAIALCHHFVFSRFIPIIPGRKRNKEPGLVPGLMSWWESLYAWLVFVLSMLIATVVCTPLIPLFKLDYKTIISTYSQSHQAIEVIFAIVWLVSAAFLYQIAYLVKLHLVFGEPVIHTAENQPSSVPFETNTNITQDAISQTQIQSNEQPTTNKQPIFAILAQQKNLPQKIFIITFVPLVVLWIYLFAKLPETKETISTNLSLVNPSFTASQKTTQPKSPDLLRDSTFTDKTKSSDFPQQNSTPLVTKTKSPELLAKKDTYEQAIKQGKRAVKLTKTAQSYDDWKKIENKWKQAIELLEAVPTSSPNYSKAQDKILQYQNHLEFARQNTNRRE